MEDRSLELNPDGNAAVATIFAPDGSVVSLLVANGTCENVAAFQVRFAVQMPA
ncbi:MAG: hypothetical protein KIT22_01100 [Verrucomicrobiae bacterium]|nr:hypothetical protein [Verrucomicrobiae bacterium]